MAKGIYKLCGVFIAIGEALLVLVVVFAAVDIFTRFGFVGAALAWAKQAAIWINVYIVCLVGPAMVFKGGHIRVVVVYNRLKGRTREVIDIVNRIALIIVAGISIWAGWSWVKILIAQNTTRAFGTMYAPYYPIASALVICMSLFLIFGIFRFFIKEEAV